MNFFFVCYFRTHSFRIPHLVPFTALLLEHLPMKKLHKKMDIFWSMLPLSELNAPKNRTVSFHFHFRLWPFLWLRKRLAANEKKTAPQNEHEHWNFMFLWNCVVRVFHLKKQNVSDAEKWFHFYRLQKSVVLFIRIILCCWKSMFKWLTERKSIKIYWNSYRWIVAM